MKLDGEVMSAQLDLFIHYEASGVVVSVDVNSEMDRIFSRMGMNASWPCTMKELDNIPTPINAIAPPYPEDLRKHGIAGQVVQAPCRHAALFALDGLTLGICGASPRRRPLLTGLHGTTLHR